MTELLAQSTGILGTRATGGSAVPTTSAVTFGPMATIQLLAALGIVWALLRYVLPRFAHKLNRGLSVSDSGAIKVQESAAFAGGSLYLVAVRDRELLLSVTGTGVTCLADLGQSAPAPEPLAFENVLAEATPANIKPANVKPADAEVLGALERLGRLAP